MSIDESDQRRLLATCVERTGLSGDELWLRYFALGGNVGPVEVEAYLHDLMPLPGGQRDVLAHAINERLDELDWLRRVPYSRTVRQAKPATGPLAALVDLLDGAHRAPPERLPAIAAAAGRELGVRLDVYLVDHRQRLLVPVVSDGHRETLEVDTTAAGRAFRDVGVVEDHDEPRLWSVLLDGTDRLGVLGVTVADRDELRDPNLREQCQWLSRLLGHLIVIASGYGDGLDTTWRRQSVNPTVELLRDTRPPLSAGTRTVAVAGLGERGRRPGTDAFDYALSETTAHLAVFDAESATAEPVLVTAAVLAAYRKARRDGLPLTGQAHAVESELAATFARGVRVSGVLAELDLSTGGVRFLTAGSTRILLVRDGLATALGAGTGSPFGTGVGFEVVEEHVEPQDWLLMHTDGVLGARLDQERLRGILEAAYAAAVPPPEVVRRVLGDVLQHHGELADDATVLLTAWSGPEGRRIRLEP